MPINMLYKRIVGGDARKKSTARRELLAAYNERNNVLSAHEIKKSSEDKEVIEKTETIVNQIVAKYGGKTEDTPLDNIYILTSGSLSTLTEGRIAGGIHQPLTLKIGVEQQSSRLMLASAVAHELFHLKSPKSAQIRTPNDQISLYRSGLKMVGRKDQSKDPGKESTYFSALEEAIVAECTKEFLAAARKEQMFSKETKAVDMLKNWAANHYRNNGASAKTIKDFKEEIKYITNAQYHVDMVLHVYEKEDDRQAYAAGILHALYERGKIEFMERYPERKKMYQLLNQLINDSHGIFKSRDEAFAEFAKANFSGNYLSLAKKVENILGEGSFRKLATEFGEKSQES